MGFLQSWRSGSSLQWFLLWSAGSRVLRLSSCGTWAQLPQGLWVLPDPGVKPTSSALAGGFLTTGPPGKSNTVVLILCGFCIYLLELANSLKCIWNPKISTCVCGVGRNVSDLMCMSSAEVAISALILSKGFKFFFFTFSWFFFWRWGVISLFKMPLEHSATSAV